MTGFTLPGKVFKTEVVEARRRKENLDTKLADLKTRSQTAGEEVMNISINHKKMFTTKKCYGTIYSNFYSSHLVTICVDLEL